MSYEEDKKLTDEAKVGDQWYVCRGIHETSFEKVTVTRVVKTQITFSNGTAIMKRTRKVLNSGKWDSTSYVPSTPEREKEFGEAIANSRARRSLDDELDRLTNAQRRNVLSTEQRLQLVKVIREIFPTKTKAEEP